DRRPRDGPHRAAAPRRHRPAQLSRTTRRCADRARLEPAARGGHRAWMGPHHRLPDAAVCRIRAGAGAGARPATDAGCAPDGVPLRRLAGRPDRGSGRAAGRRARPLLGRSGREPATGCGNVRRVRPSPERGTGRHRTHLRWPAHAGGHARRRDPVAALHRRGARFRRHGRYRCAARVAAYRGVACDTAENGRLYGHGSRL
ncbi:MAG: Alpha-ribazole-5'-phosphate phosphatase, partial [uncultured Lysobacter sp.]